MATDHLIGKIVGINNSDKIVTVQLTRPVLVQHPEHTYWEVIHQRRLLEAQLVRDPRTRQLRIEEALFSIAYHQSQKYRWHKENFNLSLLAADCKVRVERLPPAVDDQGKPREYTARELADLKGPDPKLRGYHSEFRLLVSQQMVEVFIARATLPNPTGKEKEPTGPKPVDARLRAVMIVVLP